MNGYLLCAIMAMARMPVPVPSPPPEPLIAELRPEWIPELDKIAYGIARDRQRYEGVQQMERNGMPWHLIGGIHERESSRNFNCHLHDGTPLQYRTRGVPKGRLPLPLKPPFMWEESAQDALYVVDVMQRVNWMDRESSLWGIEAYNGRGYHYRHLPSPYVWSGTTRYERGKFTGDGVFSSTTVDRQPGVAALWQRMLDRGLL